MTSLTKLMHCVIVAITLNKHQQLVETCSLICENRLIRYENKSMNKTEMNILQRSLLSHECIESRTPENVEQVLATAKGNWYLIFFEFKETDISWTLRKISISQLSIYQLLWRLCFPNPCNGTFYQERLKPRHRFQRLLTFGKLNIILVERIIPNQAINERENDKAVDSKLERILNNVFGRCVRTQTKSNET